MSVKEIEFSCLAIKKELESQNYTMGDLWFLRDFLSEMLRKVEEKMETDDSTRLNCGFLDEICVDCEEDCPSAR